MNKINVNISAPNLAAVCIDRCDGECYIGRLFHKYHAGPIKFHNLDYLLLQIDKLCDTSGYPQSTTINRAFVENKENTSGKGALQVADFEQILDQKGGLATFVVHVKYRQHSTWQGEIVWAEKNKKRTFRSALELLKLIDGALEDELNADIQND